MPFFFASAFQLTVAVLEREFQTLQAAGSSEINVARCKSLKCLAVRYLHWASQNKIPVKLDLDTADVLTITWPGECVSIREEYKMNVF